MRKTIVTALAAVALLSTAATASAGTGPSVRHVAAKRTITIPVMLGEDTGGGPLYMNRAGGGHVIGTKVIGVVSQDNNNDFTFEEYGSKCGDGIVHNGEGGQVCPFTNGSGLNARYDGDRIWAIHEYTWGFYATIPAFGTGKVALGNFGAQGDTWVLNNGFLVSVGESNYQYGQTHVTNSPYWLDDLGNSGAQLFAGGGSGSPTGTWSCVLINGGHQDGC